MGHFVRSPWGALAYGAIDKVTSGNIFLQRTTQC